ncbi:MAG: type II toxin-antitoxin system RelE/ParE family toxin [Saprospiraceae bacterium]|jgi:plasmid stabilization system protein ParE|nr:type II toxin-antitoxin system RelE/ParE family toxin [Saprospiraceae bacterium]
MTPYTVIIQPEAEADLDDAFEYLEAQKPTLGFDLLAEVVTILEILEGNPFIFQKVHGEMRRAVTRRFGYNVIFLIKQKEVFILAIMHGSRNPKRWKKRK